MTKLEIANALIDLANKICADDDLEERFHRKPESRFKGKNHPTVDKFVENELAITNDRRDQIGLSTLFSIYEVWCQSMGIHHERVDAKRFTNAVQAAGVEKARFNDGMRYIGVRKL